MTSAGGRKHNYDLSMQMVFRATWFIFVIAICVCSCSAKDVRVQNENELRNALKSAQPGDMIQLVNKIYKGNFKITTKGTKERPITLKGSSGTVLEGKDLSSGYVLHLNGADYWIVRGLTLRNAQKGIVLDYSNFCVLDGLKVVSIGMEGVHFRKFSSDNIIKNSVITDTGKVKPGYGEGVYVGSSVHNWPSLTDGENDACDRNRIIGNTIGPNVRGDNVDIKEGTTGGEISNNKFDGNGLTDTASDKSWVNMKGNSYYVGKNRGKNTIRFGMEVRILVPGWGEGNVFDANYLDLTGATDYGIYIKVGDGQPNIVYSNNNVINAPKGLTNIKTTKKN